MLAGDKPNVTACVLLSIRVLVCSLYCHGKSRNFGTLVTEFHGIWKYDRGIFRFLPRKISGPIYIYILYIYILYIYILYIYIYIMADRIVESWGPIRDSILNRTSDRNCMFRTNRKQNTEKYITKNNTTNNKCIRIRISIRIRIRITYT